MLLTTALAALLVIPSVDAAIQNVLGRAKPLVPAISFTEHTPVTPNGTSLPPLNTTYYFSQLIDHNNHSLGTFQQRYWMNHEFYNSGGPIILMTPGAADASDYRAFLTNQTINGMIAQQQHGATIVIEHRFFGESNILSPQNLGLLTIQQAIDDLVYFAQNVDLPMPYGNDVKPNTTHWVLVGGGYSGALVSWTMANQPGIFRAGYASSAVVEATIDFYNYFKPIDEHMPRNCSSDIQGVVTYLERIHVEKNAAAIKAMKDAFGLGPLTHVYDFASALISNLIDWQALQPYSESPGLFYQFCDQLEVKDGVSAPPHGWGVDHAIKAWGTFWKTSYYRHGKFNQSMKVGCHLTLFVDSVCDIPDVEMCLGTYSTSGSTWGNTTMNDSDRSWAWMVCSQVGWYQDAPPSGHPTLVSRIVQAAYFKRMCVSLFPEKFSFPPTPSVDKVNRMYGGWNVAADRLFFANGARDPWRDVTVSAEGLKKTYAMPKMQTIYKSDGFHASDLYARNGLADLTVHIVQRAALRHMAEWLA